MDEGAFWALVDRSGGPDACWPWIGRRFPNGYGYFQGPRPLRRSVLAHREAWRFTNGELADGLFALHHCDNPPCCNPAHLFTGTHTENMADMYRKDRGPTGERHGWHRHPELVPRGDRNGMRRHPESVRRGDQHHARLHPERIARGDRSGARLHPETLARGERNGNAKLTDDQVAEIRTRYATGGISQSALGREYGCAQCTVSEIVRGVSRA